MRNEIANKLKWFATLILIVGSFVNSMGIFPLGTIVLLAGGFVWLIVSILWKEPALIVTNTAMIFAGCAGLAISMM